MSWIGIALLMVGVYVLVCYAWGGYVMSRLNKLGRKHGHLINRPNVAPGANKQKSQRAARAAKRRAA